MKTREIGIYLTQEGFFAGNKRKDGSLSADAHMINEDEIISMAAILLRTYVAKTGKSTLVVQGNDGKAMMMKLVEIQALKEAADKAIEKKKRKK